MPSQLVVLGSCGAWPEPGRACAGFLIEHDGVRIVVDLGYGTAARLLAALGSPVADGLDAVIVSHSHPDHMVDLHALLRARWFGRREAPAIPLFAPDGVLTRLVELEDGDRSVVSRVFDWHPIPAPAQSAGPFRLDSVLLPHYVPNAGVRLSAPGLVIAYTGDTGPAHALAELGRGCDLYIMDATSRDRQPAASSSASRSSASPASASRSLASPLLASPSASPVSPSETALNMTAAQAGRAAAAAGARRLLLTHFWPGTDRQASKADAARSFEGEILLAEEGAVIPLP
jgi:ribonuclease BN (tRNA processing enzyme)